jgi:hypothetical protein
MPKSEQWWELGVRISGQYLDGPAERNVAAGHTRSRAVRDRWARGADISGQHVHVYREVWTVGGGFSGERYAVTEWTR